MDKLLKNTVMADIGENARRQYIDARSAFTAWEDAVKRAADVRGTMLWRTQGKNTYLIRQSPQNTQKSLGPRSPETEAIFEKFMASKNTLEARREDLAAAIHEHQRLNRALFVGRAPQILIDILRVLAKYGITEHFRVIGTHALYAYEAASGMRFESSDALATRDVDLLWDTRKRVQLVTTLDRVGSSMLGVLQTADKTFELVANQRYTAVNSKGFEVDILRREATGTDPNPLSVTNHADDFLAIQAKRASTLLDSPSFSAVIVSSSGHMARMHTVSPPVFAQFKRWMASQPSRDPLKITRDLLRAALVEQLAAEYLPQT